MASAPRGRTEGSGAAGDSSSVREIDQDHGCRADLASTGLKRTVHRHVDRVDDKVANSEFRI